MAIPSTDQPAWPTRIRGRLKDGRLLGTDGSVWVYRAVPMAPVRDAKSPQDGLVAAEPLLAAYEELAAMTPFVTPWRRAAQGNYRDTHVLLINVPRYYSPPRDHPIRGYLSEHWRDVTVERRVLLFGVRLKDKVGGGGGWRAAVDSVVETLVVGSTPISDFDEDFERVSKALSRAGLTEASSDDIGLADAWWNHGRWPDTVTLVHPEHVHVFTSVEAAQAAQGNQDDCANWTPEHMPGEHAITFAAVQDFDLPFIDPTEFSAGWVTNMLDANALAVSIRGLVEPGTVTRGELRRQRKRFIDDINERAESGKMERAEQREMLDMLSDVEGMYSDAGAAPPTLVRASALVALNGRVDDVSQVMPYSAAKLAVMAYRQPNAFDEMLMCSPVRANPQEHDVPIQTVAFSGLPSLNMVGDAEGALLGFTERDRQPAYVSPTAASDEDSLPIFFCAGATGSGKTMAMLSLADQFTRMGRPVIIVDPKTGSDHSGTVAASGGQVASLDQLVTADGIFDPIRFSMTPEVGVELAASMLMSINPWGHELANMEVPLQHALSHGVRHGATCIGQALAVAKRDLADQLPLGLISRVEALASSSPMFRAIVGVNPTTEGLRAAEGITLIMVGSAHLDLPEPGTTNPSLQQRVALALVRMMVFGSAMALTNRGGVVMLDEAWVFLGAGRAEVERLGRLARSQQVLPALFTQRVTDALDAGLRGYISRGFILPIEDADEARAACELFKIDPTPERISRITAKATMGGSSSGGVAVNWNSMRALRDPNTREVVRGAIGIYADLAGRAIPVEVKLSEAFLELASTSPLDIRQRQARGVSVGA